MDGVFVGRLSMSNRGAKLIQIGIG